MPRVALRGVIHRREPWSGAGTLPVIPLISGGPLSPRTSPCPNPYPETFKKAPASTADGFRYPPGVVSEKRSDRISGTGVDLHSDASACDFGADTTISSTTPSPADQSSSMVVMTGTATVPLDPVHDRWPVPVIEWAPPRGPSGGLAPAASTCAGTLPGPVPGGHSQVGVPGPSRGCADTLPPSTPRLRETGGGV